MKSDEEFLDGIYKKAEQRRKEEAAREGQIPAVEKSVKRKRPGRIAVIGMAAACFCFLLAFSVYGKKLAGDMESGQQGMEAEGHGQNPENPNEGIQMLDLGEDTENPIDATGLPAGQPRVRIAQMPVTLFGTVQNYTEVAEGTEGIEGIRAAEGTMAVLYLRTEEFGELEIYVTYEEEFTKGEEVALLLMMEEDMYYLTDSGQKYKKGEDGLYYNTFGEVLSEDIGEV